jgi:DNA topoisomerase-1
LVSVIDEVAARLGNTRAVCRKSYIHPAVLRAYESGSPLAITSGGDRARTGLSSAERALRDFLRGQQTHRARKVAA